MRTWQAYDRPITGVSPVRQDVGLRVIVWNEDDLFSGLSDGQYE